MDSLFTRRAPASISSWDPETYTVQAVICAGADVRGYDEKGAMIERIVPKDQKGRLPVKPVPLLLNHQRDGNSVGLGQAEEFRIEAEAIVASLKLSKAHATAKLIADNLSNNIGAFVSMGYLRTPHREYREGDDRVVEFLTDIREVSIVALPADLNASTRGHHSMTENTNAAEPRERQADATNRAAINGSIRSIGEIAGLDRAWADDQIDKGASVEEARAAAFAAMEERGQRARSISGTPHNRQTTDNPEFRGRLLGEAITLRVDPGFKPSEAARSYVGLTLPEMAREAVRASGQSVTGLAPATIIERAMHSTSDFPLALGDAVGRSMRSSYEAVPSALKQLARKVTLPDLRPRTRVQKSQLERLEKIGEHGEIKRGTIRESAESYKVTRFAKMFAVTEEVIINDDIGFLSDVPGMMGVAAANTEAQMLVDLLTQGSGLGPVMSDSKRLFHADHGNLAASAGAPDETKLSAARLAMRKQKDASGQLVGVAPKFILLPPDLEATVEKLLASINPTTVTDVNVWSGKLTPIIEPRLTSAASWYLVDDRIGDLEFGYLEGREGPQVESQNGWNIAGVEFRVRLDVAAGFVGWLSWYRNAG